VVGVNVDLLEVGGVRLEHLDEREADGHIVRERYPESPVGLCRLEMVVRCDFLQGRFGSVAREKPSGGELDRRYVRQVARSRERDLVPVRQAFHASLARNH